MIARVGERAVVLGGSLAGLLAARVLADFYTEVTLVERDELMDTGLPRRGAPQGRHVHGLLARGQAAMEGLLPGLTADLVADGVPEIDMLADAALFFGGHRFCRAESGLRVLCVSRPFLEDHVRARVRSLENVTFLDRCDVAGLAVTADGRRIIGARVFRRTDGSPAELLPGDLVVDATGRGSRTPGWLKRLGLQLLQREEIRIGLGYATRTFRLRRDPGSRAIMHGGTPDHPRAGLLQVIEGDRWILSLAGVLGDHPPTQPEAFADFAKSLRFPDIYEAIRDAEPLDQPVPFRYPASTRVHYERMSHPPDGLLVVGDAYCNTSPIYGQGMTMAALGALVLRRHLVRNSPAQPRPKRFFGELARVIDAPWEIAVGAELTYPEVEGPRTRKTQVVAGYIARLQAVAARDPVVATAFLRVMALLDPPQSLLAPKVALRVARPAKESGRRREPDLPRVFGRSGD